MHHFLFVLLLAACGKSITSPQYLDRVIHPTARTRSPFGDPALAANGARGGGPHSGGTDVFSLDQSPDGTLVLAWSRGAIVDRPGPDLVVFENAFDDYFEPVVVSVSVDGVTFVDFPHAYRGARDRRSARQAANWTGFAGMTPVWFDEDRGGDPFDGGGDKFDLADVGLSQISFVKLTAAPVRGFPNPRAGYADIDAVYTRGTP